MKQNYYDLVIHFYCKSNAKPKMFSKLANSFDARHYVYSSTEELKNGLDAQGLIGNQIILLERWPSLSDQQVLNTIRSYPTIVLDSEIGNDHSLSKKDPLWKSNGFILGSSFENVAYPFLKIIISSLLPGSFSVKETIPWHAARAAWRPLHDSNRKLSIMLEKFLESTCPLFSKNDEVIAFSKFVQNRGKGRGTFKTIKFDFVVDSEKIIVNARLDWFNKSEQSLKVLYSGLAECPYSYASINILNPKLIEITGIWEICPQKIKSKTFMVAAYQVSNWIKSFIQAERIEII